MITVSNLCKSFGGLEVLKGVNVEIDKGDVICVIGPSGSGKSTFLRCLNLLETPTSGSILFEGDELTDKKIDLNKHRQKMGMVFQQFNLFPHMTVLDNLTCAPIMLKKTPKAEAEKKRWSCWPAWGSPTGRMRGPISSPAGRSSASPSCARSAWNRT